MTLSMIYATPFVDGSDVVLVSEYYAIKAKMSDLDRGQMSDLGPIEDFLVDGGAGNNVWQGRPSWYYLEGVWDEKTGQSYVAFLDLADRDLFRALTAIRGLGPALALRLISQSKAANLRSLTVVELRRLEGVGPKLSQAIFDALRGIKREKPTKEEAAARKAATMAAIAKVFTEASGQPTEPLEPTKKPKKGTKQ